MLCRYTEGDLDGRGSMYPAGPRYGGNLPHPCGRSSEGFDRLPRASSVELRIRPIYYRCCPTTPEETLRYVHKDGLVMRHDKHAFAGEAIRSARIGKLVGDYIRILMFSCYARVLPWSVKKTKDLIDPFTGCFVSYMPFTVVSLRFALKIASFLKKANRKRDATYCVWGQGVCMKSSIIWPKPRIP